MINLFTRKNEKSPADFWREYGERYGEEVLAFALGQYLSGWDDYDQPLWGLLIATSGGFRFHHFPHEGWMQALSRSASGGEPPQEKTIFIPKEHILEAELRVETSWWKRLLAPRSPTLALRYRKALEGVVEAEPGAAAEQELIAQTEVKAEAIVRSLTGLVSHHGSNSG